MFGKFRKFANEFRRKGEMTMAPDQTTPDPSYSGGERRYLKGGRWRPDVDRCREILKAYV